MKPDGSMTSSSGSVPAAPPTWCQFSKARSLAVVSAAKLGLLGSQVSRAQPSVHLERLQPDPTLRRSPLLVPHFVTEP